MKAPVLDRARWSALWQSLGSDAPGASFELLTCLYAEPHRRYHTAKHIVACLRNFDLFKSLSADPVAVELSIWLHDAAYDPLRDDNEERSADVAEMLLDQPGLQSRVVQVRQLIMATQHTSLAQPDDAGLLVDIDLSVLALPWTEYVSYTRAVRKEYAAIPAERFVEGRIGFLKHFLAKPTIYVHPEIQQAWEHRARENMENEITELINMDALKDVEVVANLYQLSGTGMIQTVDDLKAHARVLMPGVGAEQMTRALRGLATKLWDTNHGGFRNEYRRSRGRRRAQPQSLSVRH